MATYGQRVRSLIEERLRNKLGPQVYLDRNGYEADLQRIAEQVDAMLTDRERLNERISILTDGVVASFGGLARTWCDHATLATAYQNAHAFGVALRKLMQEIQTERFGGTNQP